MKRYEVKRVKETPALKGRWDDSVWGEVKSLRIANFLQASSDSRPETEAKLLYNDSSIFGIFKVSEQYVRCTTTEFQGCVWEDSCVEFFFQPEGADGYFNFEMNCGGALLAHYNRLDGSPHEELTSKEGDAVQIFHSLPPVVDPEIPEKTTWLLEFSIPFAVLSSHVEIQPVSGRSWRANFFKCAEACSHPHWATWSPVDDKAEPNFHQPNCFGQLIFGE